MTRKRFDLTDATKKEIFNGGRIGVVAGLAATALTYASSYPTFGDYVQSISVGVLSGFGLSLSISVLRDMLPQPKTPRQSFGVQTSQASPVQSGGNLAALPPAARDDILVINSGNGTQEMNRFEAALPDGFAGAYDGQPRTITMRGVRDMFRKPQPIAAKQLHYPRPVEREAVHFWANGVQLSSDVVWKFLRYAERNRTRGAGLSERYWTRRNRSEWWNEAYYGPMIALLDYASKRSRVQLIIMQGNRWRVLAKDAKTTYRIIAWAVHGVG